MHDTCSGKQQNTIQKGIVRQQRPKNLFSLYFIELELDRNDPLDIKEEILTSHRNRVHTAENVN